MIYITDSAIKIKFRPSKLYHYTSFESAFNIINSKKLWTTQIQYLNDETEFKYAGGIAHSILSSKLKLEINEDDKFVYNKLLENTTFDHGANTFIFSLSEEPDLLSQWRGYCKNSGVAMGFNYDKLEQITKEQKFELLPCIYEIEEQRKVIENTINEIRNLYIKNKSDNNSHQFFWQVFNARFSLIAKCIKHPSFKEEKEWRLIGGPFTSYDEKYKLRPIQNMLLPYYEFELSKADDLALSEFIIGPNKDLYLSQHSFGTFTRKINKKWDVQITKTPFKSE